MCDENCLQFLQSELPATVLPGASILEVGARDVNGSIRPYIESFRPQSYLGVDLQPGPKVDDIVNVTDLVSRFGTAKFDVVISTEMLEHVLDWRLAVHNLKQVLRPGGILALTTRTIAFPYHEFTDDFWRYEPCDFDLIFADFEILCLQRLPACGVGLIAKRPMATDRLVDLDRIELYSVHPSHLE
jgi:SAM-dependent methyltransferase